MSRPPARLAACLFVLLPAAPLGASDVANAARALLDLSPERVAAFNQALRDFGGEWPAGGADLYFQSRYQSPAPSSGCVSDGKDGVGEVRVPFGRDVSFLEEFFVQDREEDYERAARNWVRRALKGSDAADAAARRSGHWQPRYDWNDGPVLGARRGMVSFSAGWSSDWRVRVGRPIRSLPGWSWRTWVGERDGERVAGFTIGRSLSAATR